MLQGLLQDVFTIDEVARAASVPRRALQAIVDAGEVRFIPGTRFLSTTDAILLGRRLRAESPDLVSGRAGVAGPAVLGAYEPVVPDPLFSLVAGGSSFARRRGSVHAFTSSLVHATLVIALLWWTSGATETAAPIETPKDEARMVFLVTPGPGGGGGGGGLR